VICMMRLFLIAVILAFAQARNLENDLEGYSFEEYMRDFDKVYPSEELSFRKSLFQARVALIQEHNSNPVYTWKMGVNKFADMTVEEQKAFRGFNKRMPNLNNYVPAPPRSNADPPATMDWRTKDVVTPIKDQGSCGSCWAFSTTEDVESFVALNSGSLLVLSPQNVVSCTPNPNQCGGTGGCGGATMELGFTYVATNGIATEANWPYTATNGKCNEAIPKAAKISGYVKNIENNYTSLLNSLGLMGPQSVTVDASTWSLYSSGIFNGCSMKSIDLDHGVQAVGYGTENGQDYWIVRNSWGVSWGEKGYIRLLRHSDGSSQWCGPDNTPQDGSGCKGGPPSVTVCGTCGIWYDTSYPTGAVLL